MNKLLPEKIALIVQLRKEGFSHRDIAHKVNVGLGTVYFYSKPIILSLEQHISLMRRSAQKNFTRIPADKRLEYSKRGGLNTPSRFKQRYSNDDLIVSIQNFFKEHHRLPLKHEFTLARTILKRFGSWNKAIELAGFEPNVSRFTKRYKAKDGHVCDSLAEKIIDDWLSIRKISHERNAKYGLSKYTADFKVNDVFIEFFGLSGQLTSYDKSMKIKLDFIEKLGLKLISIYPEDLFPKSRLEALLGIFTKL